MKKLLIIVMACYGLNARAQVDGSKDFIYLFSDSVIHANKVRLHPDYDGRWEVRADSRRIANDRIKFINSDDGFFANTRQMNTLRISSFSERIMEGKINLYRQTGYEPVSYGRRYRYTRAASQVADRRMFYNKGFGDLKKVNYHNLQQDMADDSRSMDLLAGYRRSADASRIMYVAAGATIVGSLVSFLTAVDKSGITPGGYGTAPRIKEANFAPGWILFGLSAGFAIGGYSIKSSGFRKLENAIEAYNK